MVLSGKWIVAGFGKRFSDKNKVHTQLEMRKEPWLKMLACHNITVLRVKINLKAEKSRSLGWKKVLQVANVVAKHAWIIVFVKTYHYSGFTRIQQMKSQIAHGN